MTNYWTGNITDITNAEALATAIIIQQPEFKNGIELPQNEWITINWAIPQETTTQGVWAIPVFTEIPTPSGCTVVDTVEFPTNDDGI